MDDYERMHAKYIGCGFSLVGGVLTMLLLLILNLLF